MNPELIIARILDVDPATVTDETSSMTHENWDSLATITMLLELQSTYQVDFSVDESLTMKDCATIKRLLRDKGVRW